MAKLLLQWFPVTGEKQILSLYW